VRGGSAGRGSELHEIIVPLFVTDGGGIAVTGVDNQVIRQGRQFPQGGGQGARIATGQIGAPGGSAKEGVAHEEGVIVFELVAYAPGGVAGGFDDGPAGAGQREDLSFGNVDDGGFRFVGGLIKAGQVVAGAEAPLGVAGMNVDRRRMNGGQARQRGDVVDMSVGQQIGHDDCARFPEPRGQLRGVVAGIDDHGFAGVGVGHEETIFFYETGDACFYVHGMKPPDSQGCVKDGAGAVLTVSGLGVGYFPESGCRLEVVEGVNLCLRAGRTTALVGESGCGKSITAAALGGLLPRGMARDRGEIRWADGMERGPGRGLAYVFQDPGECLNPVFTIGNQIREVLPREDRGRAAARMEELLRTVGFEDPERVQASYPHQLSGGMQQRAMLAMALAGRPRVLVADEPTTALDVTVQALILRLLAEVQRREQLAVLLITHNLGVVAEIADEIHVMYAGRMVEQGPVDLLRDPLHPYVRGLLKALPRLRGEAGRLEGMEGSVPPLGRRPAGCRFHPRCPWARAMCAEREPDMRVRDGGHAVACWACAEGGWA